MSQPFRAEYLLPALGSDKLEGVGLLESGSQSLMIVELAPYRGRDASMDGISLEGEPVAAPRHYLGPGYENTLAFCLPHKVAEAWQSSALSLQLMARDDNLELSRVHLFVGSDHVALRYDRDQGEFELEKPVTTKVVGVREYVDEMRGRLRIGEQGSWTGPVEDKNLNAKRYFFALDLETNSRLMKLRAAPPRSHHIDRATRLLVYRIKERVRNAAIGRHRLLRGPTTSARRSFEMIMQLQQWLVQDRFDGDLDQYEEAFLKFASGNLRFPLESGMWTTEPNSGHFFLFGEFAIVCAYMAANRSEAHYWERLASVHVGAQSIYTSAYPPPPSERDVATFGSYKPKYHTKVESPKLALPRAALDEIEHLADGTAFDAFRGFDT